MHLSLLREILISQENAQSLVPVSQENSQYGDDARERGVGSMWAPSRRKRNWRGELQVLRNALEIL